MKQEDLKQSGRRPFEAPRLVAIELAAEEVLGNACKLSFQLAANDGNTCSVTVCASRGS
jgi:hypothetical protein